MTSTECILTELRAAYPLSLRAATLAERSGYTTSGINAALGRLICNKQVSRVGTRGHYRYLYIRRMENPVPLTVDEVISLAPETAEVIQTLQHSLSRHSEGGKKITKAEARALLRLTLRLASNLVRDILD